ncbi:MAG: hypothetical protein CMF51_04420 [Legionellales bacterium]|nr:hypothetical protein [Legionellales bacterium]|tara:strand:+ start:667 stop:903 length:237 start_codon:yes stop_codon:yes gene_type:complete
MPRKKTTKKEEGPPMVEKNNVSASMNEIKMLLNDKIAETIAGLVNENTLSRESAERATAVLQAAATGCVDTIRANRGL